MPPLRSKSKTPPPSQFSSTQKEIHFATISTSVATSLFIEAAQGVDRCQVVAVHSRDLKTAKAFGERHGIKRVYIDLQMMAGYPGIDAVYIASPNSLHADHAMLFIKNRKHVLIQKPICATEKELLAIQAAAKKQGVLVMECTPTMLMPNFKTAKDALSRIGPIHRFIGNMVQHDSRYSFMSSTKKKVEVPNVFNSEFGGGALMDLGVHLVSAAIALLGPISSVVGALPSMMHTGVDSGISVLYQHKQNKEDEGRQAGAKAQSAVEVSGPVSSITVSKVGVTSMGSEIQAEKGTLVIEDITTMEKLKIVWTDGSEEVVAQQDDENLIHPNKLHHIVKHFVELAVNDKKQSPINSLEHSLAVLHVLDQTRIKAGIKFPCDVTAK